VQYDFLNRVFAKQLISYQRDISSYQVSTAVGESFSHQFLERLVMNVFILHLVFVEENFPQSHG